MSEASILKLAEIICDCVFWTATWCTFWVFVGGGFDSALRRQCYRGRKDE